MRYADNKIIINLNLIVIFHFSITLFDELKEIVYRIIDLLGYNCIYDMIELL